MQTVFNYQTERDGKHDERFLAPTEEKVWNLESGVLIFRTFRNRLLFDPHAGKSV